mmetsp:Transcript_5821/g.12752  ORF Transcript_5821/g.12752 Transcript_5821/m.12752 type:complete len:306 (-) Transcript_5821:155-1072(-)
MGYTYKSFQRGTLRFSCTRASPPAWVSVRRTSSMSWDGRCWPALLSRSWRTGSCCCSCRAFSRPVRFQLSPSLCERLLPMRTQGLSSCLLRACKRLRTFAVPYFRSTHSSSPLATSTRMQSVAAFKSCQLVECGHRQEPRSTCVVPRSLFSTPSAAVGASFMKLTAPPPSTKFGVHDPPSTALAPAPLVMTLDRTVVLAAQLIFRTRMRRTAKRPRFCATAWRKLMRSCRGKHRCRGRFPLSSSKSRTPSSMSETTHLTMLRVAQLSYHHHLSASQVMSPQRTSGTTVRTTRGSGLAGQTVPEAM